MTLRDLINGVLDAGALQIMFGEMNEYYYSDKPDHTIDRISCSYSSALRRLLELEDGSIKGSTIVLLDGITDEGDTFIDVILVDEKGDRWALDFVPWSDLIDTEVSIGNLEITSALCHILWEITFYGFNPEHIAEEKAKLDAAADEVSELDDIDDLLD